MRKHLTYSNIVATVALFVVLGGSAIAAKAIISKPSQLGKGVVTNKKVKKGTLKKDRLSKKAINQLKGQKGEKGDRGETGPSNTFVLTDDSVVIPPDPSTTQSIAGTLNLPNGAYLFTAKFDIAAQNFNGSPDCAVSTVIGDDPLLQVHDQFKVPDLIVGADPVQVVLHGAVRFDKDNANPRLAVNCTPDPVASQTNIGHIRFTATEVGNLTTQP